MSVRISVESLSGCAWNGCPSQRGIRTDAWLDGLVDVRDEPLGAVIDSLRPYRHGLLRISEAAASLRVFGVFSLDDTQRALETLAQTLPIEVRDYGPLTLIERRQGHA